MARTEYIPKLTVSGKAMQLIMEIAAADMSESGVKKVIRQLKDANLIRRVGPDKGGRWEIVKPTIANERIEPKVD